ncbi:putative actin-like protein [Leishmania mexicana MHOM/GT/2001/U1103]|uniref:Actin-like protein n=1 Tax=Leishmania mexicana (strain MHOM/GT/2001/U1103) TaxID=929439 RepID=E9B5V9_LEIMU|nr:putative actin-like protein [Leishmania mexicana MHOM/GT/2001/U1103]CBZ30630.1 putative actin-like protein [Leishmania mexicana MHOM/GT/2001/U1103]
MESQQYHYPASSTVSPALSRAGVSSTPVLILDLGSRTIKSGLHTATTPHLTPALVGTPKYPRCLPQASSSSNQSSSISTSSFVVGSDAASRRAVLRLSRPIQHGGVIMDWVGARPLLRQSIQNALVPPPSSLVVRQSFEEGEDVLYSLVETPFASRPQRARLAELLFEGPDQEALVSDSGKQQRVGPRAAGVFCGVGPLLALYATGQTTGVVVDVGDGAVSTAAAADGYVLPQCLQREADGATGVAVTSYLTRLLYQSGVLGPAAVTAAFRRSAPPSLLGTARNGLSSGAGAGTQQERELVYAIKEACCTVSATPLFSTKSSLAAADASTAATPSLDELNSALIAASAQRTRQSGSGGSGAAHASTPSSHPFTLPDGSFLEVGAAEAAQASEVLFYPVLMGSEGRGVVDVVLDAVAAAPAELQPQLLGNVVVTGGATCSAGFGYRFFKEMQQRIRGSAASSTNGSSNQRICVSAPEQRAYAAWMGASYVAQISSFASSMVVTRAAYEEEGEAALARRVLT